MHIFGSVYQFCIYFSIPHIYGTLKFCYVIVRRLDKTLVLSKVSPTTPWLQSTNSVLFHGKTLTLLVQIDKHEGDKNEYPTHV